MTILTSGRGEGAKGRGASGLRKDGFEELDATVEAAVRFPELRMEHQYPKKIASAIGAHN